MKGTEVNRMQCSHVIAIMHEYYDDPSDEQHIQLIHEHIQECDDCLNHFTQLGQVSMELEMLEWKRSPVGITNQILQQLPPQQVIHTMPFKRNWRYTLMRGVGIAACIAFFVGVGVWSAAPQGFSVSASDTKGLVVGNGQVVVPKGQVLKGDLVVQNGDAVIRGKVVGNVTALGGKIYKEAGADITGDREEVLDTYHWIEYYSRKVWNMMLEGSSEHR